MNRFVVLGSLVASSMFTASAEGGDVSSQPRMMVVAPAAMGVTVVDKDVTYMLAVGDGSKLAAFLPLPPAMASSDLIQVFASSNNPEVTDLLVRVVVLKADGHVVVLSQMIKPSLIMQSMAMFLVPLGSTVLDVSVKSKQIQ